MNILPNEMGILRWLLQLTTWWIRVCHKRKGKWYSDQMIFSCIRWWAIMGETITSPNVFSVAQPQPMADEVLIQLIDRINNRRQA